MERTFVSWWPMFESQIKSPCTGFDFHNTIPLLNKCPKNWTNRATSGYMFLTHIWSLNQCLKTHVFFLSNERKVLHIRFLVALPSEKAHIAFPERPSSLNTHETKFSNILFLVDIPHFFSLSQTQRINYCLNTQKNGSTGFCFWIQTHTLTPSGFRLTFQNEKARTRCFTRATIIPRHPDGRGVDGLLSPTAGSTHARCVATLCFLPSCQGPGSDCDFSPRNIHWDYSAFSKSNFFQTSVIFSMLSKPSRLFLLFQFRKRRRFNFLFYLEKFCWHK